MAQVQKECAGAARDRKIADISRRLQQSREEKNRAYDRLVNLETLLESRCSADRLNGGRSRSFDTTTNCEKLFEAGVLENLPEDEF